MGNSLKCCLACVLPCGSFDLIRVVHLNGQVDEFSPPIRVREVMAANPNHVLSSPCYQSGTRQIMIVSPDSELKPGQLYFLIPSSSVSEKKQKREKKRRCGYANKKCGSVRCNYCSKVSSNGDDYLKEILSESKPSQHRSRRSVRRTVWRPKLESIPEES